MVIDYDYDTKWRLDVWSHTLAANSLFLSHTYTYSPVGNITDFRGTEPSNAPRPEGWAEETLLVRGGLDRSRHGETSEAVYLQSAYIETSVHGGINDGGNIVIENPRFMVLNNSEIHAHAEKGNGGDIQIKSEQFVSSAKSSINASSKLGLDGEVQIESVDVDMEAKEMDQQSYGHQCQHRREK